MHIMKYPEKGRFSRKGIVIAWACNEGDSVKKGDSLLKIESSGEILEIESAADGALLKTLASPGQPAKAAQPLAIIGPAGTDVSGIVAKFVNADAPAPQAAGVQAKAKAKPAVEAKTAQPSESKKEKVMAAPQTTGNPDNVTPILMPQAGQSMEEGTILAWKVKEGDTIAVGQVIMEIETDKATMEVEATDAGRIGRIIHSEGAIVEVKKPVALIADNDVDIEAWLAGEGVTPAAAPAPVPTPAVAPAPVEETPAPAPAQPAAAVPEGAVVPILMPQAGQSMEEGTILAWKVKEGDTIEVGQIIMEIETDKATMEVEAVDAGRIAKIVAAEGAIVEVKVPVAYIAEESVDIDAYIAFAGGTAAAAPTPTAPAASPKTTAPATQKTAASVSQTGRVKASPAARKAAQEKGIDLASVSAGSGPGGRILSTDVEESDIIPTETQVHPLTKMRKAIANNLLYSKQNVPHFYAKTTIDAGLLFTTYRKTKEQFKCSVNDFVTRACAKAVRQFPAFRSQYNNTEIIEKPSVNIGIAVGTDEGLTVPVVLDADRMNLEKLAARTREVVESARNGKLEGMGHGIFTITNLGMFGVEEFQAIINPPESAILAVGTIREAVVVENGAMRPSRLMTVTLSVDHRVIDGVVAAQFLQTLKELLENPEQLVS